jgi:hypothetical protein
MSIYTFIINYPNNTSELLKLTIREFTKEFKKLQKIHKNQLTHSILEFDTLFNSEWD